MYTKQEIYVPLVYINKYISKAFYIPIDRETVTTFLFIQYDSNGLLTDSSCTNSQSFGGKQNRGENINSSQN